MHSILNNSSTEIYYIGIEQSAVTPIIPAELIAHCIWHCKINAKQIIRDDYSNSDDNKAAVA